jgi:hypothetical protein
MPEWVRYWMLDARCWIKKINTFKKPVSPPASPEGEADGGLAETSIQHLLQKGNTICYKYFMPQNSKKITTKELTILKSFDRSERLNSSNIEPGCFSRHARESGHPGQPEIALMDSCYRIKSGTGFAGMTVHFAENSLTPDMTEICVAYI